MTTHHFKCPHCGDVHDGVPDLGFLRPDQLLALPKHVRDRCYETDDACALPLRQDSGPQFFLRGVRAIPITTAPDGATLADAANFAFGPWAEVEQADWQAVLDAEAGDVIAPFLGTLGTRIPGVPESFGAANAIDPGNGRLRPLFGATKPRSPIAQLQRSGVPYVRAMMLAHGIDSR